MPVFSIPEEGSTTSPSLVIEDLDESCDNSLPAPYGAAGSIFIDDKSNIGSMAVRDCAWWATSISYKYDGGNPQINFHPRTLFVEDVQAGRWSFGNGAEDSENVWAYQFNPEVPDLRVMNNGAWVWICGLKTEDPEYFNGNTPVLPQDAWGQPENIIHTTNSGETGVHLRLRQL